MISDPKVAKEVRDLILEFLRRMNDSLWLALEKCPKEEFEAYRIAVANVLAAMLDEVAKPLYRTHPALKPKEMD